MKFGRQSLLRRSGGWEMIPPNDRAASRRDPFPGPLPPPVEGYDRDLDPMAKTMLSQALSCAVVGAPDTVRQGIEAFARRTGADELMVTAQIFDHEARVRSFEILADVHKSLSRAA